MNSRASDELQANSNNSSNTTSVIILTLLHPLQAVPVQSWTFEPDTAIRIGRSTDNEVILYSAVVSRHHVEVRPSEEGGWEVVNLGANGTYMDGKRITKLPVFDGMVIRLASSGPQIQIRIEEAELSEGSQAGSKRPLPPLGEDKSKDTLIT
ncbi:MAG: FHA domain-containing protein [Kamptonema sp. SIO4C4]|nr:FHA domain-containing protein [Kamptonema sp. SIO4C4]